MKLDITIHSSSESFVHIARRLLELIVRRHRSIMSRTIRKISLDAVVPENFRHIAARAECHHRSTRTIVLELQPTERVSSSTQILRANMRNTMRGADDLHLSRKIGRLRSRRATPGENDKRYQKTK